MLGETHPRLQVLPNASEETLQQLETNLAALPPISQLLQDGNSVADITAQILGPLGVQEESTTSITPRCARILSRDAHSLSAWHLPLLLRRGVEVLALNLRLSPCLLQVRALRT